MKKPIRYRLIRIVLLAIGITSALTIFASSWIEIGRFNESREQEAYSAAHIFAAAVSEPLADNDRVGALKALRAISKIPLIQLAQLKDSKNRNFAELGGAIAIKRDEGRALMFRRNLKVTVPVINSGREIGQLMIVVDTSDLVGRLFDELLVGLLATLVAGIIGIFVAIRLQERITAPLRDLSRNMVEIRETQNFGRVVVRRSDDETGLLVDSFNDMMSHIGERDKRLKTHRENLEVEVANRTSELKIAKDVAENANAAKSSFLATMSHEIRTPMNGILVMAELLARTKMRPQHKRYADVIVRSGESLMAIINDILDFSKIESGKLELEKIEMDLSETSSHVLNLFWERAQSAGIDIAAHVEGDVPDLIEGDPVRINQILSNLLNNALKFTEKGTVFLMVKRLNSDAADGECLLEFSVSDTGIGIAKDKLGDIFKSFSQADQSTTRQFGGTGLGLAICKKLVEVMGGEIGVESTPGKGSTFKFTLPTRDMAPQNFDQKSAQEATKLAENSAPSAQALSHALVVQSTPATSRSIISYLQDQNIKVQTIAPDEFTTVDLEDVNAIFADAEMVQQISLHDTGDIAAASPVLVIVSAPGDLDDASLFELGLVDDMVMCPIDRSDMRALISRLKDGKPMGFDRFEKNMATMAQLPRFAGMRVLVADDNDINLEVAREALGQLNIEALFARDGREAVDAVLSGSYDAILMDCSMPVLNGFDATREIRAAQELSGAARIPIVALTAQIAGGMSDEWIEAGMDRYLTKPFSILDLATTLKELCPNKLDGLMEGGADAGADALSLVPDQRISSETHIAEPPVLDTSQLREITGLDDAAGQEMILRILKMFAEHAPVAMNKLTGSNGAHAGEIATAAHALKSMCSNIGANRLFSACEKLEEEMRAGRLKNAKNLISHVETELDLVLKAINQDRLAA